MIVRLAQNSSEIKAAGRLRYEVFYNEMGATPDANLANGIDSDEFDKYCEHLIAIDPSNNKVIGTYRMLSPDKARHLGRWYSDSEFDLQPLTHIFDSMVEVGRSCVHKDYRKGSTIAKLWTGIVKYLLQGGYKYLIGCACVPLSLGEKSVAQIIDKTMGHLAPENMQVIPHLAWQSENIEKDTPASKVVLPPLLKGYLRAGAWVCGQPAYDPIFKTADVLILLSLDNVENRHMRHFVERQL